MLTGLAFIMFIHLMDYIEEIVTNILLPFISHLTCFTDLEHHLHPPHQPNLCQLNLPTKTSCNPPCPPPILCISYIDTIKWLKEQVGNDIAKVAKKQTMEKQMMDIIGMPVFEVCFSIFNTDCSILTLYSYSVSSHDLQTVQWASDTTCWEPPAQLDRVSVWMFFG